MDVINNIKLVTFLNEIYDYTFSTIVALCFWSLCRNEVEIELNSFQ